MSLGAYQSGHSGAHCLRGGCSRQTGYDACILPRSHRILQFAE
jgi:hypothetical protein